MKMFENIKVVVLVSVFLAFGLIVKPLALKAKQNNWNNVVLASTNTDSKTDVEVGGGRYGVVYYNRREGNSEIYLSLVKLNGEKSGPEIRITNDPGDSMDPVIIWNGEDFGIFWYESWNIYYARVSADGNVVQNKTLIESGGVHPSAVWNPSPEEYGLVWWGDNTLPGGARFVRVSREGNVVGEVRALNSVNGGGYYRPRIDTDGAGFGVAWSDLRSCNGGCREVVFAYVNADGEKAGDDVVLTSTGAEHLNSLVWNGNEFAMVSYGNGGISIIRSDKDGNRLQFAPLTGNPPYNNNMGLAWNEDHYVLSTIGISESGGSDIWLANYDRTGNIQGTFTRVSSSSGQDYYPSRPAVSGKDVAVAWVANLWEPDQNISFAIDRKY